jgi:hypothetical protein
MKTLKAWRRFLAWPATTRQGRIRWQTVILLHSLIAGEPSSPSSLLQSVLLLMWLSSKWSSAQWSLPAAYSAYSGKEAKEANRPLAVVLVLVVPAPAVSPAVGQQGTALRVMEPLCAPHSSRTTALGSVSEACTGWTYQRSTRLGWQRPRMHTAAYRPAWRTCGPCRACTGTPRG